MVRNNKTKNIYEESIIALKEYLKELREIPNEKMWNTLAIKCGYLSSKSIGYLSSYGFNKLCRNLMKEINQEEGKRRRKRKIQLKHMVQIKKYLSIIG